jgi:hypothetical protein
MKANFDATPRVSATGVSTAAILLMTVAMAASTLFTPDLGHSAGTSTAQVTQSPGQFETKQS